jgi:hippurate hydrolase
MLLGAAQQLRAHAQLLAAPCTWSSSPPRKRAQGSGAQRMIADGLFERFPCNAIFGLHNTPGRAPRAPSASAPGPSCRPPIRRASPSHGRGGHAARARTQAVDPVLIAGSLVMALQSVVSRNIDPRQTAIVTVGALHAGRPPTSSPTTRTLALAASAPSTPAVRERARAAHPRPRHPRTRPGYGGAVEIDYERGYPVVVNSEAETALRAAGGAELVGAERVVCALPAR